MLSEAQRYRSAGPCGLLHVPDGISGQFDLQDLDGLAVLGGVGIDVMVGSMLQRDGLGVIGAGSIHFYLCEQDPRMVVEI